MAVGFGGAHKYTQIHTQVRVRKLVQGFIPDLPDLSTDATPPHPTPRRRTPGGFSQLFFFVSPHMSYEQGLFWMGVTILAVSSTLLLLRFPMWGGMLTGAETRHGGCQEEDYYLSEWTTEEQDSGLAMPALVFAAQARLTGGAGGGRAAAREGSE
ncbi:hypothetical protein Vafri_21561 [Volvox africanus]|uniref:Uncharacterized protein n=1 Tax=Volvox africanus TaxID=51714 RepID=A0A8J4BTP0_9CHLO|nr:hypothetical protein Vafri_21561 [Volvox africanus]